MREKQKEEAIRRLDLLFIMDKAIEEFIQDGGIYKSIDGGLYWLTDEEHEFVEKVEEDGNLVYHAILSNTEFGKMLTLLYVSKHEEEWGMDKADIVDKIAISHVINMSHPELSEIGTIAFESKYGGLVRVG